MYKDFINFENKIESPKMSSYISHLEEIGFLSQLPPKASIDDYEIIKVIDKSGENIILYREKSEKKKFNDTADFSKSLEVYNSYLG